MPAYLLYLGLVWYAVARTWPGPGDASRRIERQVVTSLMAALPVAGAAALTAGLMRDNSWAAGLFGLFSGGLLIMLVGLIFRHQLPGRSSVAWRLLGWSAAASVVLIPSITVLLCWIPGLLVYLIPWPEGWLSDSKGRATPVRL